MKRSKIQLESIRPLGLMAMLAMPACLDTPREPQSQPSASSAQAQHASAGTRDMQASSRDSKASDRNPAAFDPDRPNRPYRPDFDAEDMSSHIDQPLNPLPVGAHWTFRSVTPDGEEIIQVSVEPGIEIVAGAPARIVHDTARLDGELIEDTIDWFAQDDDDNVWYLGEATSKFDQGTVSHEGSWRTGVDGARPGIDMLARRRVHDTYRQEFLRGHAEDFAEIVALDTSVTVTAGTFHHCIQTRDQSTLDVALDELKTFCPHIGLVLTEEGDVREELISYGGLEHR